MDYTKKYDAAALKHNTKNIIWISVSFSFIYFGINTYKNFAVPLLGNLGSICLGLLYTMGAVANFIVPAVLVIWPNVRNCLIVSSFVLTVYILQYAYLIPGVAVVMCFITGIFFAISWSTQSILLAINSVNENRSRNSNLFYGIFMLGNVFGNAFAYVLLDIIGVDIENRGNGWNGSISFLFIVSALIGSFLMFFVGNVLPTSLNQQVEVVEREPQAESQITQVSESTSSSSLSSDLPVTKDKKSTTETVKPTFWHIIWIKTIAVFKCVMEKRMLLLVLLFINNGYAQIVVASQVTRQIQAVELIGLAMSVYSIVEVITTVIFARIADKIGHRIMIGIATICELLAIGSMFLLDKYQGLWIYIPPIFFGIMDTIYQTECISIVGKFFDDEIEDASATYRLIQGLGSSLCSFITPLFVSAGATVSTPNQLIGEMIVATVLSILAYAFLLWFLSLYEINKSDSIKK